MVAWKVDKHPAAELEHVFGVQMGTHIGTLMLGCWQTLFIRGSVCPGDIEAAVAFVSNPLLQLFTARRWEVAALSRWTGVVRCEKRIVLGAFFNNILPESLIGLAASIDRRFGEQD